MFDYDTTLDLPCAVTEVQQPQPQPQPNPIDIVSVPLDAPTLCAFLYFDIVQSPILIDDLNGSSMAIDATMWGSVVDGCCGESGW